MRRTEFCMAAFWAAMNPTLVCRRYEVSWDYVPYWRIGHKWFWRRSSALAAAEAAKQAALSGLESIDFVRVLDHWYIEEPAPPPPSTGPLAGGIWRPSIILEWRHPSPPKLVLYMDGLGHAVDYAVEASPQGARMLEKDDK